MNRRFDIPRALLVPLVFLTVAATPRARAVQAAAPQAVALPYALRDASGQSLVVNPDGSVMDPQGELISAGGQLFVGNDFQYASENPQGRLDSAHNELLFPPVPAQGQAQGLTVSRRVSLDPRGGWWRF